MNSVYDKDYALLYIMEIGGQFAALRRGKELNIFSQQNVTETPPNGMKASLLVIHSCTIKWSRLLKPQVSHIIQYVIFGKAFREDNFP